MKTRCASTGNWQIFVPLADESVLNRIVPDFDAIDRLSRDSDAIGIYVYYCSPKSGATARCRNFVPTVGIKEDPATGTAAGALACVLFDQDKVDGIHRLVIEQGEEMGQPCRM